MPTTDDMALALEGLLEKLRTAGVVLDDARAASNRYLAEKREAEEHLRTEMEMHKLVIAEHRHALAFARSVIKSGEPWTEQCEQIIGALLK